MTLRVGIVGAGAIGARRAAVAAAADGCQVAAVADPVEERAAAVAARHGGAATGDWRRVVDDPALQAVVVSTVNKALLPVTVAALQAGKHVLCEKPLGRNGQEAAVMADAARRAGRVLKVGFTLRFHPALRQARRLCAAGALGPLLFARAVYGHGGRPGYDQEWRGDADLAGGGELLDQGVHLLDLCRWFVGDFEEAQALTPRWFWDIAPLEDNAFVLLRNRAGQVASLHTSWTQWRNRFSFEVFGRDGYARIEGLGGSYGPETLTVGRRRPESGPPEEQVTAFDGPDRAWAEDWQDFVEAIALGRPPEVGPEDGLAAMRLVDLVYAAAKRQARGETLEFEGGR